MADETGSWMPMYWGDYFGDTMHLTTEQHGAYLLLMGAYWRRGKPLPDDDAFLANITKLSKFRWKNFRKTLSEFFDIHDGVWEHKRVQKEIVKSTARLASARAAGKAGGIAKALAKDLAKSKLTTTTVTEEKEKPSAKRNGKDLNDGENDAFDLPLGLDKLKDEFEKWWEAVPLKVGKGGARGARGAYTAARRKVDAETLLAGIKVYAKSVKGKERQWIAHPKTWLNEERWLDETASKAVSQPGEYTDDQGVRRSEFTGGVLPNIEADP